MHKEFGYFSGGGGSCPYILHLTLTHISRIDKLLCVCIIIYRSSLQIILNNKKK